MITDVFNHYERWSLRPQRPSAPPLRGFISGSFLTFAKPAAVLRLRPLRPPLPFLRFAQTVVAPFRQPASVSPRLRVRCAVLLRTSAGPAPVRSGEAHLRQIVLQSAPVGRSGFRRRQAQAPLASAKPSQAQDWHARCAAALASGSGLRFSGASLFRLRPSRFRVGRRRVSASFCSSAGKNAVPKISDRCRFCLPFIMHLPDQSPLCSLYQGPFFISPHHSKTWGSVFIPHIVAVLPE